MHVISNKRLVAFAVSYPDASVPLQTWRKLMEAGEYKGIQDLRNTFGSVDIVNDKYVFDIRGNHYRLITGISFEKQVCYIKAVLTHIDYDKGDWK